jgi:flagellar biosynthesis/type III secretory pathway protein FliH
MKSSSRVIRAENTEALAAGWQPQNFGGSAGRPDEIDPQQVLELFNPAVLGDESTGAGQNTGRQNSAVRWSPEDLGQAHVFVPSDRTFVQFVEGSSGSLDGAAREAQKILQEAQQQAAKLLADAREQIEQERKAAFDEGYARAQDEARSFLEAARNIVEQTEAWQAEKLEQGETVVVEMVKEIAQKIFGDGIVLSNEQLQLNLNNMMVQARALGSLKIFINPKDAACLESDWAEYQSRILGSKIQIIPMEGIVRGGYYIEGQMGSMDARVGTQLETIFSALTEAGVEE